jgi:hypothetical protein
MPRDEPCWCCLCVCCTRGALPRDGSGHRVCRCDYGPCDLCSHALSTKHEEWGVGGVIQLLLGGVVSLSFVCLAAGEAMKQWPTEVRDQPAVVGSVEAVGQLLYTEYLLPFEAAGLLLMAALVAAAMLAKTKGRKTTEGEGR